MAEMHDQVLVALRRIMRANSLYSRHLGKSVGLTTPQLVVMRAIRELDEPNASRVAREVSLSQATVTIILNRLEKRGLLCRERSTRDRRRVDLRLTEAGHEVLRAAPAPLQDSFLARFSGLASWEQHQIVAAMERVAAMMDAGDLDAAPLLMSDDLV